jgi:hypothetical protein
MSSLKIIKLFMLTEDKPLKPSTVIHFATSRLSIDDEQIHISNIHQSRMLSGTSTNTQLQLSSNLVSNPELRRFRIFGSICIREVRVGEPPGVVDLVASGDVLVRLELPHPKEGPLGVFHLFGIFIAQETTCWAQ